MDTKDPKEIQKHETFKNLFPIDETVKERIKQDMFENGFDQNQPVVLAKWGDQDEPVCVDGYTRLQVAKELTILEIPTVTYTVEDEQEALEMALKRQANRRSLNDADIYHCIETVVTRYGDPPNGGIRYTVQEIADRLGISKRKAERTMRIVTQASEETKEQVKSGITSINKAEGNIKSTGRKDGETNEKPKTKGRASKTVKIDPDQWEELKEIAEVTNSDVEETVYEAIALYLGWELDETEELPSEDEAPLTGGATN